MTDTNFISSEPRNKSFDENARLFGLDETRAPKEKIDRLSRFREKVCFNPYCNDRGSRLIHINGSATDYRDHRIPYCVCNECFFPFTGWGPDRDYNESFKPSPNSKICYYHLCNNEGKHWIDIYKLENARAYDAGWLGVSMPYRICERCYAFFEGKRIDIDEKLGCGKELKDVTVEDFCSLLDSHKSYQEKTRKYRLNTPFTGQVDEHRYKTQE
jgi:hypothetical protein